MERDIQGETVSQEMEGPGVTLTFFGRPKRNLTLSTVFTEVRIRKNTVS
jgi:hypothetical protein